MYNKKSFQAVENSKFNEHFKKPLYDSYCLANIPGTILNIFGKDEEQSLPDDVFGDYPKHYDKVVLFLMDAFGYSAFEKFYHKSSFLNNVVKNGVVSKLTTQFPSTTSANITTLHSGLPINQSGVIEWYYYEPKIDAVYSPLMYKKALPKDENDTIDAKAETILPNSNLYQKLPVSSYVFQYEQYNKGPYSQLMQKGSQTVDFTDLDDGLTKLKDVLKKDEKSYSYFYHSNFDSVSHKYGPNSKETEQAMEEIFYSLDQFFNEVDTKNTLFILTADHGQTTVIKENAIYLNLAYPEIIPYFKKDKKGELIVPCGSFRDMFLHIEKDHIDDVFTFLQDKLDGKAEVYKVEDLIEQGFFGSGKPTQAFLDKVGDIVILAYVDQAIWWYVEDKIFVRHLGMHGGLIKEELEIPFLVYPIL